MSHETFDQSPDNIQIQSAPSFDYDEATDDEGNLDTEIPAEESRIQEGDVAITSGDSEIQEEFIHQGEEASGLD